MTDDVLAVLIDIRDELRQIRVALQPRSRPNDAAVSALLHEIVVAVADHAFTASDLLQRIPTPDDERLRSAIVAACGSLSPRKIGHLLRRYEGRDLAGLRVVRTEKVAREGTIWQIVLASLHV